MNNHKLAYILEIVWAVVTLTAFGLAVHSTVHQGPSKSIGFYLVTLVALLMYFIRRQRRLHDKLT